MPKITFNKDVRPIFAPSVSCMKNVVVADEEGTENLDLSNYDTVKRFHQMIQAAIHGHETKTAAHAMPPGGLLGNADIETFDQWIVDGMLA